MKELIKALLTTIGMYDLFCTWRKEHIKKRDRRLLQKFGWLVLDKVQRLWSEGEAVFADFGTMLGLVRDNGFIPHDDDMDFSVIMKDGLTPAGLLRRLLSNGFQYLSCYEFHGRIEQLAVSYKKLRVDFFLNYKIDGMLCYHYFGGKVVPDEKGRLTLSCYRCMRPMPLKLISFSVGGRSVRIPENYIELLETEYGQGWRVPEPLYNPEVGRLFPPQEMAEKGFCAVPAKRVYELG